MSETDLHYRIQGGHTLKGDVTMSGSKNAALPLIAGSVLCSGETVLHNVPNLRDVRTLLSTLDFLGAETSFQNGTVRIRTHALQSKAIPMEFVSKLRGSIVLLGPLLARFGVVEMAYPGGCVLGKRPVGAHIAALKQLGAEDMSTDEMLHLQGQLKPGHIILPEFSVTATENAILAAALIEGETRIDMAAGEPHVQDVQNFIQEMGAEVDGVGSHTVRVRGKKKLSCVEHRVPFDYLEAGAFIIAALVTKGKIRLHDVDNEHLLSFLDTVSMLGGITTYNADEKILFVDGELSILKAQDIKTNIFPGFPTDLQAPFGVALTQATGVSRIFERLFEGRMAYLYELEKMGARIEILNSHEALIIGPTPLRGRTVASNDIRAGVAMVIAGLCAQGETLITDIRYIERGYDKLEEKLTKLGAKIEKQEIKVGETVDV
ncbi:MAG: UDP-N-acetylglucosamine 1-carboxyvinyltransferase [Candidatus Peribacteraceae bacterium]|nr:UDP-N-acetylglucosamine 1-carboxyvinyltransferase [Candidatus Peribacteraceae bacterium]